MTEEENHTEGFVDRMKAMSELETIVQTLNQNPAEQDPVERAYARNHAIARYKNSALAFARDLPEEERVRLNEEADNTCLRTNTPENYVQEALLAEFERAKGYYTGKRRQILGKIPKSRLEESALRMRRPYKIDGNEIHNAAAKAHMEYLFFTDLASKIREGKATEEEIGRLNHTILSDVDKDTRIRLKDAGEKDEKYINFMAALERRAAYSILRETRGAHEAYALNLAKEAEKDFRAALTNDGSYTIADYARSNLNELSEENPRIGMKLTYDLLAKQDNRN